MNILCCLLSIIACWVWKNEPVFWDLQIDCATEEHEGTYLCSISNVLEERWTEPVDVEIGKSELHWLCPINLDFLFCICNPSTGRNTSLTVFSVAGSAVQSHFVSILLAVLSHFWKGSCLSSMLLGSSSTCTTGKWCKMKLIFAPFFLFPQISLLWIEGFYLLVFWNLNAIHLWK